MKKIFMTATLIFLLVSGCVYGEIYEFSEDFSQYAEDNCQYTTKDLPLVFSSAAPQLLAENSIGAGWYTSDYWIGRDLPDQLGRAYIDVENHRLAIKGLWNNRQAIVYLDSSKIDGFQTSGEVMKLSFSTTWDTNQLRMVGLNIFMSEDERTFYQFGQKIHNEYDESVNGLANGAIKTKTMYSPFVKKYKDSLNLVSVGELISYDTTDNGWNAGDKTVNWEITVKDGMICWIATGETGSSWQGKILDTDNIQSGSKMLIGLSSTGQLGYGYFNNISYKVGNYYLDGMGEPANVLYADLVEEQEAKDNIIELKKSDAIRKIANHEFINETVQLSEDMENWDDFLVDKESFLNEINEKNYKYIKLPHEGSLLALTDMKENDTIDVDKDKTLTLYAMFGGEENVNCTWSSDNTDIATVEDGKVFGLKDGSVTISAKSDDGVVLKTNVRVVGRMTKALESDDPNAWNEYIAYEKSVIDVLNKALKENNREDTEEFMFGSGEFSFSSIDAVKTSVLKNMGEEERNRFINRFITYVGDFPCAELEDIENLEKAVVRESCVDKLLGITDVSTMLSAIEENNDILELPTDNEYYKNYRDVVLEALLNQDFKNYDNLSEEFVNAYVMKNLQVGILYSSIRKLCEGCSIEIGYNQKHYDSIDKDKLAKKLLSSKDSIGNTKELCSFIDSFNEKVESGGSGGGGGGGSKSSGTKIATQAVVTPVATLEETVVEKTMVFNDVPTDHWAYEPIRYMSALGVADGYESNEFCPDKTITRSEFVKMVLGGRGITHDTHSTEDFLDISETDWFYENMRVAREIGLILGNENMCYPNAPITREEISAILFRAMEILEINLPTTEEIIKFSDDDQISQWAFASVKKLQSAGVINGFDNKFNPAGNATRAEAVSMIYRMRSFENKEESDVE